MRSTVAVAVAVSAAGALAFGPAIPADAVPTYYYAGGTHQPGQPSQTSVDEWRAFLGQNHVPEAYTVQYPRDLAPLVGDKTLDDSVGLGVEEALELIEGHDEGDGIYLVGVSQGAVVMAETKRALIDVKGIDPKRITVVTFGDPTNPDGGFLSKLDRWNVNIPGYTPVTHTPGEGGYETVVIEYDLIADSPDNLNPVAWANAAMGAIYDHPTYSKDLLTDAQAEGRVVSNTEEWVEVDDNGQPAAPAEAYYQHNLIKQKTLPITRPIRDIATAITDDQGDAAVDKLVDQLDNALRPIVDAGYDGGEPGGSRHVGRTTIHYQDDDGNPVADPNRSAAEKPNKPLRDAVKKVRTEVKKAVTDTVRKLRDSA
jgi:PE-PPE domain-containing protein